jgi:hypothetical protein
MISYEDLIKHFKYDHLTGQFERIKTVRGGKLGPVGTLNHLGYIEIPFKQKRYSAHRMAWLYMTKKWPVHMIDHINGKRNDNRFENLREATNAENHHNLKAPRKDNASGFLGVYKRSDRNKWSAQIKHHGKLIFIGNFDSPEKAYEAYLIKKREIHSHCTL